MKNQKAYKIAERVAQLAVAIILIQTLRFKFTAHPDSVFIFSQMGIEPYGRIVIGIAELIAGILVVIPKTVWIGALLSLGLMGGAILSHLTILGIEVQQDNGALFITAIVTFLSSLFIIWIHRNTVLSIFNPVLNKEVYR